MTNPPPAVKLALEGICLILGEGPGGSKEMDWKMVRQIIIKDSFIQSIVNMKTDEIS